MARKLQLTAFCCHNALYGGLDISALTRAEAAGVHKVEVPCSGKIEPIYILKAFENGADGVLVLTCLPRQCNTIEGSARQDKRITRTRALLAEAGLEPERLILVQADRPAYRKFDAIIKDALKTLAKIGPSPAR